ncbi:MAG: hypothetical protein HYS86_02710 [Candidatus Chisholmbacteria bacterium]|nr:hypothetical protein [Candidatus Chisholmbacteria bacterium]
MLIGGGEAQETQDYRSGLEQLESYPEFAEYGRIYWFCREVAIAKKRLMNPGNPHIGEQRDVLSYAQDLLDKGVLNQEALNYIYGQFEFNPEEYTPPDLKAQGERIINALRGLQ